MVDVGMVDVEQRLRDLLTDDHLAVRVPARVVEAVQTGVRRRRRRARIASGAGVVAVAAGVVAAVVVGPAVLDRAPRVSPGGVANTTDGVWKAGQVTVLPRALTTPSAMAVSGGIVWVAGPAAGVVGSDVLARIDAGSRHVTTTSASVVSDLAATPRHLWVAMHGGVGSARCTLELRETKQARTTATFPLACGADTGTPPIVTANGAHAWVATDDGNRTHLRLYTAGSPKLTAERVLPGRLAGPRLLAIGGTSVYIVTAAAGEQAVLHRLSATDLTPITAVHVPGARLMAYGSDQLYVADATGVVSFAPDLTGGRTFVAGPATRLTTGNGLVWCDPAGGFSDGMLVGLDPRTGEVHGVADTIGDHGGLLRADGAVLWVVRTYDGVGVGVQSAQREP